ncbi:succinate-semialdehyde dehydrogenase [Metarhizium guizhouense ARSEF 977]|uniref:Succinate-semialdehyde dehydrogenase n=1 Tax=Metarhizium guizhouense (strain ARSEF 977) TaxID=1276136 RepID=A0A0B4GGB0_METGA|nr:succinate-semialdehyde dehydrogenase [Metarhizium guizhouense ARSEF 977]
MEGDKEYNDLLDSLNESFYTGKYSDCTIVCGDYEQRAHKLVICPRSTFFEAAFAHEMKEKATGIIELQEDDPEAVKLMVYYLYHLDYPYMPPCQLFEYIKCNPKSSGPSSPLVRTLASSQRTAVPTIGSGGMSGDLPISKPDCQCGRTRRLCTCNYEGRQSADQVGQVQESPNLLHHSRVYALAEKYGIQSLKNLAVTKFRKDSETWWNHEEFAEAAKEAYTTTRDYDRGMRDAVVAAVQAHRQLLNRQDVQSVMKESQLAYDVLMASRRPDPQKPWR